jgi:hypothetical protein
MTVLVVVGVLVLVVGGALALDVGGLASRTTAGANRLEDDRARQGRPRAEVPGNVGRQIGWGLAVVGVVMVIVGLVA